MDFLVFPCKVLESRSQKKIGDGFSLLFFLKMNDLFGVGLSPRFEA